MIVFGLTRLASTMRSRSCPADRRDPTPARFGASVPCSLSWGNGPEWHNRQSPTCRLPTIARPRAGSPSVPVSDAGIASPTTAYGTSPASAAPGRPPPLVSSNMANPARAALPDHSAKRFRGDRPEPAIRDARLRRPKRCRRVERAHTPGTRDLDELAVRRLIYPGDRDAVIRRHQAVAGIDQLRHGGRAAGEQGRHGGRANLC